MFVFQYIRFVCLVVVLAHLAPAQPTALDLQLSTYLGGEGIDNAVGVAFDSFDDLWICGNLNGPGFPFPDGVTPSTLPGGDDIFVVHIDVDEDNEGNRSYALVQTIIIGGVESDACGGLGAGGGGILITGDDRIFIGGRTRSQDFPELKTEIAGDFDFFVAELGPVQAASPSLARSQGTVRLGPYEVVNAASFGGPAAEEFCGFDFRVNGQDLELFIGGSSLGDMPLGPGAPDHTNRGRRDLILLRVDGQLDLVRGIGFGGSEDEFFGDLSVRGGGGRLTASSGSRQFEGLNNPSSGQGGITGRFDPDTLESEFRLHAAPDGLPQLILQKHAMAVSPRTPDGVEVPPVWLAYGTASDAAFSPTAVVIEIETSQVLHSAAGSTARVLISDGAGSVHFGFFGSGPTGTAHGLGVCRQDAGGAVFCNRSELLPSAGELLFLNNAGRNSAGQIAIVGGIGDTLAPSSDSLQEDFSALRDGFVIDTQQSLLLGVVNAAFNGDIGPGDLATAFGAKIGPRKDSFAFSDIVNNALETNVEGVEVVITREDGSTLNAPVLNASFGQTTFEMPTTLLPGEAVGVRIRCGELTSNAYHLTLSAPAISPFLFNGNEAVVQHGATAAVATEGNPLRPGEFAVLWGNSGIERTPLCPGPGSVADATGNPLHRLGGPARTVMLGAITAERQTLFTTVAAFAGSPPGQLCNNVVQVNFALADAAAWSQAEIQAAVAASRSLRDSDPDGYNRILAERPWMPIEDPISGEAVPVSIAFGP